MLKTSKPVVTEFPPYRPNVCNAVRKDGKACQSATDKIRCPFHPIETHPNSYAEPPAAIVNPPRAADLITAALASEPLDDPKTFRLPEDVSAAEEWDEPEVAQAGLAPQAESKTDDAPPPGHEWQWQRNAEGDDYERKAVPFGTPQVSVRESDVYSDDTEVGSAYHEGQNADFDYRWMHKDEQKNLIDRKNGFTTVKKGLDNRFPMVNGAVTFGDLVLARRPKSVTEQRAYVELRAADRYGSVVAEFEAEAANNPNVGTFGAITSDNQSARVGRDPEDVRGARRRTEEMKPAPRGKKSYAFPALPFQRDKVAERHGSVGG